MKKLILQVNIPSQNVNLKKPDIFTYIEDMYQTSSIMAKKYAKKVEADYYIVTNTNDWELGKERHPAYQKLKVYDFTNYDAICYIDSDYIIKDNAPNVFDLWKNNLCAVRQNDAGEKYRLELGIPPEYFPNTGFVYYPKDFLLQTKPYISEYMQKDYPLHDQGLLGKMLYDLNIKFLELEEKDWNPGNVFGTYGDHYGGRAKKLWGSVKY